jgi:hypothetical protein
MLTTLVDQCPRGAGACRVSVRLATTYFSHFYAITVYGLDLDDVVAAIGEVGISGTWCISLNIEETSNRSHNKERS